MPPNDLQARLVLPPLSLMYGRENLRHYARGDRMRCKECPTVAHAFQKSLVGSGTVLLSDCK
jgi:hypothetical protein